MDAATLALAASLRESMKLGEENQTDLLIIGASATDSVGHIYGTGGTEMCLQLLSLDRYLGEFFDQLDAASIDYAVVLTSDHGGYDAPERQRVNAVPDAERIDPATMAVALGKAIGRKLGLAGPLLHANNAYGDYYVSREISKAQRSAVMSEAVSMLKVHRQIAAVFTKVELAAMPSPRGTPDGWTLAERARASFDPDRSGDFMVLLKPRVTPVAEPDELVTTHGSPWDHDRKVPILFWRKGIRGFEQPLPVETIDILPTLAAIIGLNLTAGEIDGRCLDLVSGSEDSCLGT